MSETSTVNAPLLVHFAANVAQAFEELQGRSIAVSEVEPFNDKTNRPSLPIAVTALINEQNTNANATGGATSVDVISDVLLQFIFEPTKYKDGQNQDTPFFAFYDYEAIRNRLLEFLRGYRGPGNESASYRTLDVESDEFAVYLAFRLNFRGKLCYGATASVPAVIDVKMRQPAGVCEPCTELPSGCDLTPCDPPAAHLPLPDA